MEIILASSVVWVGMAIACAIVATNKGRSGFGWFLLGLLFSLIALIIVLVLPSLRADPDAPSDETHVKCPHCAEYIKREAIKCKHCGEAVEPSPAPKAIEHPHNASAIKAEQLGARRDGHFWVFDGHRFASAGDVIAFVQHRRT